MTRKHGHAPQRWRNCSYRSPCDPANRCTVCPGCCTWGRPDVSMLQQQVPTDNAARTLRVRLRNMLWLHKAAFEGATVSRTLDTGPWRAALNL